MNRPNRLLLLVFAVVLGTAVVGAQEIYSPGNGVSPPTVVKRVRAEYTQEAKDAHIVGSVLLETVVLASGNVGDVTVVRSLDPTYGLDQQAVKSMKQWEFKPGTKDGKPVAVRINVEITFTLK